MMQSKTKKGNKSKSNRWKNRRTQGTANNSIVPLVRLPNNMALLLYTACLRPAPQPAELKSTRKNRHAIDNEPITSFDFQSL